MERIRATLYLFAMCLLAGSAQALSTTETTAAETLHYYWEPYGLKGRMVYALDQAGTRLLAGTDDGVYKRDISTDVNWTKIGLSGKCIEAVHSAPSNPSVILAGWGHKNGLPPATADTLFKSTDGGKNWFAPCPAFRGRYIESIVNSPQNISEWFLASDAHVFHSTDGGTSWTLRFSTGIAMGMHVLALDPLNPGNVYVGGESGMLNPVFLRSTDIGNRVWFNMLEYPYKGDNAVYSIAVDPNNPRIVVAGMELKLYRTTDHGAHREYIMKNSPDYFYIATMDPRQPRRMFLGGVNRRDGNRFHLYWSPNYGDTCQAIDSPTTQVALSMILNKADPSVGYVGTLGAGIYKITYTVGGSAPAQKPWCLYE